MRVLAMLLATLPLLVAADPPPGVATAAQRRAWVWFGTTETAARARAASAGQVLTVVWRDGVLAAEPARGVQVALQGGVVIEAIDAAITEGCREVALLPLLGQTEAAVTAEAQRLQRPVRVVWRDGSGLPATMDYLEARLNLHIAAGLVVAITGG